MMFFFSSFITSSGRFNKFDLGNRILFQIKVSGRKFKENTSARFFTEVTV